MERISVLVISGPAGVGKSSVAYELSRLLQAAEVGHGLIDTDELDRIYPVPADLPRLTERNLATVWEGFQERRVRRLIVVGVYLDRPEELAWVRRAIPRGTFVSVRLLAKEAIVLDRVAQREIGSGMAAQQQRSREQIASMAADQRLEIQSVQTDGVSVVEVARRVLLISGWLQPADVARVADDG